MADSTKKKTTVQISCTLHARLLEWARENRYSVGTAAEMGIEALLAGHRAAPAAPPKKKGAV